MLTTESNSYKWRCQMSHISLSFQRLWLVAQYTFFAHSWYDWWWDFTTKNLSFGLDLKLGFSKIPIFVNMRQIVYVQEKKLKYVLIFKRLSWNQWAFFDFHFKAIQWPYLTIETHIKFLVNVTLILTLKIQGVSVQVEQYISTYFNCKWVDCNTLLIFFHFYLQLPIFAYIL